MKNSSQTISLFRNDERKIIANGYPYLRIHCVHVGSVDGLDVQVLNPRPVEVSAEVKCRLIISQAESFGKLSEAHLHELVTAIGFDSVLVSLVAVDTLLELIFVEDRHNLREDCFSLVHGLRTVA